LRPFDNAINGDAAPKADHAPHVPVSEDSTDDQ
jgi:hypothetical protein